MLGALRRHSEPGKSDGSGRLCVARQARPANERELTSRALASTSWLYVAAAAAAAGDEAEAGQAG